MFEFLNLRHLKTSKKLLKKTYDSSTSFAVSRCAVGVLVKDMEGFDLESIPKRNRRLGQTFFLYTSTGSTNRIHRDSVVFHPHHKLVHLFGVSVLAWRCDPSFVLPSDQVGRTFGTFPIFKKKKTPQQVPCVLTTSRKYIPPQSVRKDEDIR